MLKIAIIFIKATQNPVLANIMLDTIDMLAMCIKTVTTVLCYNHTERYVRSALLNIHE